jgi:hypothetical protein
MLGVLEEQVSPDYLLIASDSMPTDHFTQRLITLRFEWGCMPCHAAYYIPYVYRMQNHGSIHSACI